jgi:hypothetical protein
MQTRELDRAAIRVAKTTAMSGTPTADEIDRVLRTRKGRNLERITCSTLLGPLMAAGLFVALAPMSGRADDDKDRHPGHEDSDKGIRAEIAALQAQVASLQSTVSALQGEVSALQTTNAVQQNQINNLQTNNAKLQNQVTSLQTSNTTLQKQLAAVQSNHALLLGPFVSVDPNPEIGVIGPNITFTGANIHIVSGSGSTNDNGNPTGLGNLIIGYDEDPGNPTEGPGGPGPVGPGQGHPPTFPLQPGDRSGSHNLVIGSWHRFTRAAFGGFVAGELNVIGGEGASVSGGGFNTANGRVSSVSGGGFNTASGLQAVVTGGSGNTASGFEASVLGGTQNTADSNGFVGAPIVGATVVGGEGNTASGGDTVVLGGQNITDNNNNSIAPQPPFP